LEPGAGRMDAIVETAFWLASSAIWLAMQVLIVMLVLAAAVPAVVVLTAWAIPLRKIKRTS